MKGGSLAAQQLVKRLSPRPEQILQTQSRLALLWRIPARHRERPLSHKLHIDPAGPVVQQQYGEPGAVGLAVMACRRRCQRVGIKQKPHVRSLFSSNRTPRGGTCDQAPGVACTSRFVPAALKTHSGRPLAFLPKFKPLSLPDLPAADSFGAVLLPRGPASLCAKRPALEVFKGAALFVLRSISRLCGVWVGSKAAMRVESLSQRLLRPRCALPIAILRADERRGFVFAAFFF